MKDLRLIGEERLLFLTVRVIWAGTAYILIWLSVLQMVIALIAFNHLL